MYVQPIIPVSQFAAVDDQCGDDNSCNTRYADTDGDCDCDVCNVPCNKHTLVQKWTGYCVVYSILWQLKDQEYQQQQMTLSGHRMRTDTQSIGPA